MRWQPHLHCRSCGVRAAQVDINSCAGCQRPANTHRRAEQGPVRLGGKQWKEEEKVEVGFPATIMMVASAWQVAFDGSRGCNAQVTSTGKHQSTSVSSHQGWFTTQEWACPPPIWWRATPHRAGPPGHS
jgi:ribosomal protein L37E